MHFVALHDLVAQLGKALVGLLGGIELVFHPIDFLLVPQMFDELLIVGVVVLLLEGGELLEALDEQAFALEIGKAEGADDFLHAFLFRPCFDGGKEGICHFLIVDAVEPGEADALLLPFFVGGALQDARDSPDDFAVAVCKKVDGFRCFVVVIVALEELHFVRIEGRDEVGIVLIEPEGEVDEFPLLFGCFYFFDFDHILFSPLFTCSHYTPFYGICQETQHFLPNGVKFARQTSERADARSDFRQIPTKLVIIRQRKKRSCPKKYFTINSGYFIILIALKSI